MYPIKLSENFTLEELIKSQVAERHGIDNTPTYDQIQALNHLANHVLQPLRDLVDAPITVTSGFRCAKLNERIGGAINSQHRFGEAADIECNAVSNAELAYLIATRLQGRFDQLILEFYDVSDPRSGWVHVSSCRKVSENRGEILRIRHGDTKILTIENLKTLFNSQ